MVGAGLPYGPVAGLGSVGEIEVTLGMMLLLFMLLDWRQPMLKPMPGILRKKHESVGQQI